MLIDQSKAKNFDGEFCFVKSLNFEIKNREMLVRGLYGNREFHVPFWSMIYLASRIKFNVIINLRNEP